MAMKSKLNFINIIFLFTILFLSHQIVRGDDDGAVVGSGDSDSVRVELDQLNSKIHQLESLIHKKSEELRTKEKVIKVKSDSVASLQNEVASLKVEKLQLELEVLETRTKELEEKMLEVQDVHSAWLPPWLAAQLATSQAYLEARWIEHGKPALETFAQKASEKKAQAEKWAEPHLETVKTKWIPAAKEQLVILRDNVGPHVQLATERTKNIYAQSKEVLTPHVTKVKEAVDPHFQVAKKFCKPYIDQVAVAAKPHLEKAQETVKPYTNEAVQAYGKFFESATKV